MPRQAKPRWDRGKQVWLANIGERDAKGRATEVYAPKDIGPRDELRAMMWFEGERKRRSAPDAPATQEITVDWVCEHYLAWADVRRAEGKLESSEYANKARHLGILLDTFSGRDAANLTPDEMTTFGETLLEHPYSPVYVRNVCATARSALNWAVRKAKVLERNPVIGFKSPTVPRAEARFAERKEAAAFLAFCRSIVGRDSPKWPYHRLTLLLERCLIRTGARPKEFCRLKWEDFRWKGWQTSSGEWCAKAVIPHTRWKSGRKTGKPRTIYFTPTLTRALRRMLDRGPLDPVWVFVHTGGRGGRGANQPWESGSVLSKTIRRHRDALISAQTEWRKAKGPLEPWQARWAAVPIVAKGADKLVNYRWRHTAISTLLMLGVDVATVAELTGTSPDMIYRHYGHLLNAHLAKAAETLHKKRLRA